MYGQPWWGMVALDLDRMGSRGNVGPGVDWNGSLVSLVLGSVRHGMSCNGSHVKPWKVQVCYIRAVLLRTVE